MKVFQIVFAVIGLVALFFGDFVSFIALGTLSALMSTIASPFGPLNTGALYCTFPPIEKTDCVKYTAGIECLWLAPCSAVDDLTFDTNRCITAIIVDATDPQPGFRKIAFKKDTAFFNQTKTRVNGSNISVTQDIQINETGLTNTVKNAFEDMDDCCCLHAIVKDNGGTYHYVGINYNKTTGEYSDRDLITGDGFANTGADPTNDSAEYQQGFNTTTSGYAPHFKGGLGGIPIV